METKIKRGLGVISDLEIKSPLIQGINKTSIEGGYLEIDPKDRLSCVDDLKKNIKTQFEEAHFNQSKTQLIEVKGNTIINQELESSHQLIICVENDANLEINILGKSENYLSCGLHIHLHKNITANIKIKSELAGLQNYLRITQKQEENSKLNIALQLYSINQTVLLFNTDLIGETSSIDKRVFIKAQNSTVDSEVKINHDAPRTNANMVVNGTLENSKLINENNIKIKKQAPNSNGYEHSKFILLDDTSTAVSIPNLEIANNDVSCSHGSTISSLNEQELFYLQSRGITKQNAIDLIMAGLELSVLDCVSVLKVIENE